MVSKAPALADDANGLPDYVVDATDTVEVYQNGKVMTCQCDHKIGTEHDTELLRCANCGKQLVDKEADEREFDNQTSLGQFV